MNSQHSAITHYAILIGINIYSKKPLQGCVRDVQHIKRYLQRTLDSVHIQTFTATQNQGSSNPVEEPKSWPMYDNVISSFEQAISLGKAGDFVYIHFSGHGTTLKPFKDPSASAIKGSKLILNNFSNSST